MKLLFVSLLIIFTTFSFGSVQPPAVNVRLVNDEAEAGLAVIAKKKGGQTITDADWQRVFQSEGYTRLKKRETAMQRSFEDAEFKTFVLSDQLVARAQALEETLDRWKRADTNRAARLALAYLPEGSRLGAKIYPSLRREIIVSSST